MTSPRQPVEHRFAASAGDICWFEWGVAQPGAPTLLLLHATGFHARLWDQIVALLPADQHIIAPDTRGHGRSFRPELLYDWLAAAGDFAELIDALDLTNLVVVGHSMGGYCAAGLAAVRPHRIARITLIDPVILPPAIYAAASGQPLADVADHPVARRRNHWDSVAAMVDRMATRPPYDGWVPAVLDDYCRYGLLPLVDGGFELACPPALEASVYLSSLCANPYDFVANIRCPALVLRAKAGERASVMDFSNSPTSPQLASLMAHGRDEQWADCSHFIPMEVPDRVAALIRSELLAAQSG